MKKYLLCIVFGTNLALLGQSELVLDSLPTISIDSILNLCHSLQANKSFDLNYRKIKKYEKIQSMLANEKSKKQKIFMDEAKKYLKPYQDLEVVCASLYNQERHNYGRDNLTDNSYIILETLTDLKSLSALLTIIQGQLFVNQTHRQIVQKKLIHTISLQMQTIAQNTLPLYNYPTIEKKKFKGLQIQHANDLLSPSFIQQNNDMDYTGGLKVGLITDMLKIDLFKPTQSYQVITYGGEVYTPYFKDTNLFIKADTFNVLDRPHGSFQYIGIENHGISEHYKSRWVTNIQVGIIGGRFGYNFQYYLHRDLSVSPAPVGWDAQIGFPGRLSIQGSFKYERLFCEGQAKASKTNKLRVVPSFIVEGGTGHFMTYADIGFHLSTHNFLEKNQLNLVSKAFETNRTKKIKKRVPYADLNVILRGVKHNAMLHGFGLFSSKENNDLAFAQKSKYVLSQDRIKPLVVFSNLTFGIQLSNFNLFYKYSIKSSEYKSDGLINTYNDGKLVQINPNTRWHHYACIGLAFTL